MATTSALTSAATTAQAAAGAKNSRTQIAKNFDQFLLLLTTQLKNQNPLDPLDTNQFTQQLVQFASVEQQLQTNDTLSSLLQSTQSANATNALGFVGAEITASGATAALRSGSAQWQLNAPRAAAQATISIVDKNGNVVFTDNRSLQAGAQNYNWNGRTSTGTLAPEGDYTIGITARDATGQGMTVKTEIVGLVDGVDLTGATPVLTVGSVRVPIANVKSIRRPN